MRTIRIDPPGKRATEVMRLIRDDPTYNHKSGYNHIHPWLGSHVVWQLGHGTLTPLGEAWVAYVDLRDQTLRGDTPTHPST